MRLNLLANYSIIINHDSIKSTQLEKNEKNNNKLRKKKVILLFSLAFLLISFLETHSLL